MARYPRTGLPADPNEYFSFLYIPLFVFGTWQTIVLCGRRIELNDDEIRVINQSGRIVNATRFDQIAELKMVRALQMRINTRHERYSKLVEGEQADKPELLEALDRLAEREEKAHRAAREIVQGLNR